MAEGLGPGIGWGTGSAGMSGKVGPLIFQGANLSFFVLSGPRADHPQDISQEHIDNFELKFLEKLPVQEEYADLSVPFKSGS